MTKDELDKGFAQTLEFFNALDNSDIVDEAANPLFSYLYTPPPNLNIYLDKLQDAISVSNLKSRPANYHNQIGQLLEQIACLCFQGLSGVTSLKSFQSPGPQYDLLITGDKLQWMSLCKLLYMGDEARDILVEVKATESKVTDNIFSRLCSLLDLNLFNTTKLGVFFTLNGATGFPVEEDTSRQRKISDSRLRQLLFLVGKGKYVIVLDKNDIKQLDQAGALIKIIISKIRDIEHLSGVYISPDIESPIEIDLPNHLQDL